MTTPEPWGAVLPTQVWLGCDAASDQPTSTGNGGAQRWAEDLEALAAAGVRRLRIGVDWSRLMPTPGRVNGEWVEWYRMVGDAARRRHLDVWWCLQERSVPSWFANDGGFGDRRLTGRWWPRWVETAADHLGDLASGWVPIDDPAGVAQRAGGDDPARHAEALTSVAVAWRDAWRLLRGPAPVATCLRVGVVRPADHTVPAQHQARERDHLMWRLWLQAWRLGVLALPGRGGDEIDELGGSLDVFGVMLNGADATSAVEAEDLTTTVLERCGDQAPERPLHVTVRPGHARPDRCAEIASGLRDGIAAAVEQGIDVTQRWVAPGIAGRGAPDGLLDTDRRSTELAEALGQERPR